MANSLNNYNPWKGLNFYNEGEILYGRNRETESLSQYILNNTQTVLYGKSGIGKSSIINAGIFPIVRKEGMIPIPMRLDHNKGVPYVEQIRAALKESRVDIHEIVPVINAEKETLWEFFHRNVFFDTNGTRARLLLVFDQFEEIFTLQRNEIVKRAFFDELADLLNDITPLYIVNANKKETSQHTNIIEISESLDDLDIKIDLDDASEKDSRKNYLQKVDHHIVFTLREDFLSYLERYTAYIPAMKSNRYALMPINEEQAADIIMKPVEGMIDKDVAKLIIQKVTGDNEFKLDGIPELEVDAAVLSLYLSRLFIKKSPNNKKITAELVNQFSSVIIKDFYEESVANLPPKDIEILEEQLLTHDGRRDNVSRNDLIREGVSLKVINTLVEDKKLLRQFSYQDNIRVEFMHDILCPIVDERIMQRNAAKRVAEEQKAQEEKQKRLLEEEQRKREKILADAKAERIRMEKEAQEQRKKNKIRVGIAFALLLLGASIWFGWYFFKRMEFTENYASFTIEDGWPVGIGRKVKYTDRDAMPVYYQLVRNGFNKRRTRVNVMNWDNKPTTNAIVESSIVGINEIEGNDRFAADFALKQLETSYWIYTPDNKDHVQKLTAFDINNKELYSLQFFKSSQGIWANFIDQNGQSLRVKDNGADRFRISIKKHNGHRYHSEFFFYNESGVPEENYEQAFGYKYNLNDDGLIMARYPLDIFGDSIVEGKVSYEYDEFGRVTKANEIIFQYSRNAVVKTYGNRSDTIKFDVQGRIIRPSINNDVAVSFAHSTNCDNPNQLERRERANKSLTISYFTLTTSNDTVPFFVKNEKIGSYHSIQIDTTSEDGLIKVTKQYLDEKNHLTQEGSVYNCETSYYNDNFEMLKQVMSLNGSIKYSWIYEYQHGRNVSQAVMGLEGKAIRCPNWDSDNLNYYKMRIVRDIYGFIVAFKGVNEFGEESLITTKAGPNVYEYNIVPVPPETMSKKETDSRILYGKQVCRLTRQPINKLVTPVEYIHILDLNGSWYKAGVRDGDLLISEESILKVARPNPEKMKYDILEFAPESTSKGAEHYPVYFTEKEMERFNQSKQQNLQ